jgi:hypothetical protein
MKKCSDGCMPCCDFCIHAEHEELFLENGTYAGRCGPIHCKLHPDEKHDTFCETCSYCNDFYCFRAKDDKSR